MRKSEVLSPCEMFHSIDSCFTMSDYFYGCGWFGALTGRSSRYSLGWDTKMDSLPKHVQDSAGTFSQPTIGEIERDVMKLGKQREEDGVVDITVRTKRLSNEHLFDTSALQANGPNNAVYQVASNFNCLEMFRGSRPVGEYLNGLMTDSTQGPSASFGAACGAILLVTKNHERPINLLSGVGYGIGATGKFQCPPSNLGLGADWHKGVKIGFLKGTRACYDRSGQSPKYDPNGPIIHQVYTSSPICVKGSDVSNIPPFLNAAYEGAYMVAALTMSPMLVLTLVGGGVHGNPTCMIVKAIELAHKKYGRYLSPECEVRIPIYDCGKSRLIEAFKSSGLHVRMQQA